MNVKVSKIIATLKLSDLSNEKVSSIRMILKKLFETNSRDAEELVLYLCEKDILFTYNVLKGMGIGGLLEFIRKYISEHIQELMEQSPVSTVNTALCLDSVSEIETVLSFIKDDIKRYYIGNRDSSLLLMLHRFLLENVDDYLIDELDRNFSSFFSVYSDELKDEVIRILDIAKDKDIDGTINKIIKVIGIHGLIGIVGIEETLSIFRKQIIIERANVDVWHQYIDYYFDTELNEEDRLENITWFVPIFAEEQQDVYLYAIWKNYKKETEAPYYSKVWEIPNAPETISDETRQFIRGIMNQEIDNGLEKLVKFMRSVPKVSPFFWDDENYANKIIDPQNEDVRQYSDSVFPSFRKIKNMFQNGVCVEDIAYLYFNSFLHEEVAIEDLIVLVNEYNVRDSFLSAIRERFFWGALKSRKATTIEISPLNYRSIYRHKLYVKENSYYMRSEYNSCVQYKIESIFKKTASITIVDEENIEIRDDNNEEKWSELLKDISELLSEKDFYKTLKNQKARLESLSDFGIERFQSDLDFGQFIQILLDNTKRPVEINRILEVLLWNTRFVSSMNTIDANLYSCMEKYAVQAGDLFKKYLNNARGANDIEKRERLYEQTLKLYFGSVFKTIISIEQIVDIANDSLFESLIMQRKYLCRPWRWVDDYYYLCRLNNCKCGPIAFFNGEGKNYDNGRSVEGYLKKIVKDETGKTIKLEFVIDAEEGHIASLGEIRHIFELISRRKGLWKGKRVPDANGFINECPEEIISNYCKAIYIRRTEVYNIRQLIYKLYTANPFKYVETGEKAIYYYSSKNDPMLNATLQNLVLNVTNVNDLIYIFFNSPLKIICGVDELIKRVAGKNSMQLVGVDEEIRKYYKLIGVVRGGLLYSIVLEEPYEIMCSDGIFQFEWSFYNTDRVSIVEEIGIVKPQHILMTMYLLQKNGIEGDQYCIEYLRNNNIGMYGEFCRHFELKNENASIYSLYKAYVDAVTDMGDFIFDYGYASLAKYENNSGSYISLFASKCEEIENIYGKKQVITFMNECIDHMTKIGTFDEKNEYALIMQAAKICMDQKWKEEAIAYLLRAKSYKDRGIVNSNKSERYLRNVYREV